MNRCRLKTCITRITVFREHNVAVVFRQTDHRGVIFDLPPTQNHRSVVYEVLGIAVAMERALGDFDEPVCDAIEEPRCTAHRPFHMLRGAERWGGSYVLPGPGEAASSDNNEWNAVAVADVCGGGGSVGGGVLRMQPIQDDQQVRARARSAVLCRKSYFVAAAAAATGRPVGSRACC